MSLCLLQRSCGLWFIVFVIGLCRVTPAAGGTAALLKADVPGEDPALIGALATELKSAGYDVEPYDLGRLDDPADLNADKVDLLVISDAGSVPASSTLSIERYLGQGGDLIALKTPLGRRQLVDFGGKWVGRQEYQIEHAASLPPNVLADFKPGSITNWRRISSHMSHPTSHEIAPDGPGPGLHALHVTISKLEGWDTFVSPDLEAPFAEGHTLTVFAARGGPRTKQLSIEWTEKDGSRWIAVVALTRQWRQYILTPRDFAYWTSNPKRGQPGDQFNPANAQRMSVGLAFSHTGIDPRRHEYWVGPVGTMKMTDGHKELLTATNLPKMDTLCPQYKMFECRDVATLIGRDDQVIIDRGGFENASMIRSPHPRPRGGGFDKGRNWRWIPLIEARTANGDWRGTPATVMVHAEGPFKGGVWASFGIEDASWYKSRQALEAIGQVARAIRRGVFILDGGTNFYTFFEDQPITAGVRVINLNDAQTDGYATRVTLVDRLTNKEAWKKSWPLQLAPGEIVTVTDSFKPRLWPSDGFICTAEILVDGEPVDRVVHEVNVYRPKADPQFITVKDRQFMLDGKRWRAHGINYMPSSGIGTEDGPYFEHWIGARSYDPEVIQRDLEHVKDLGYNAVSIFTYHQSIQAQNLLDILRRLDLLGIKANLSLRPGTPMDFRWAEMREIIEHYRLAGNDTVFAYDLAWEPSFGKHENRLMWDEAWANWIVERYGSIENAERDWAFKAPRDSSGKITNPSAQHIDTDGDWRRMTAAYRRFLDTLLYEKYSRARRLVLGIDPNHLVSFRMSEAGNPDYRWEGRINYDFPYLASAVDFLAPEAYGRIGDWEKVKPGWFEFEYARWAAPQKPMIWAEMGVHTWELSVMDTSPDWLAFQADYYRDFYRMLIASGAEGIFSWWYPGGFRVGENSDYGVINPDGSDRPVSKVIREHTSQFLDAPPAGPVDHWIEIDRDRHPDGLAGIYDTAKDEFWQAIEAGKTPGLRTAGTGTDSSNCPLLAVGNTSLNGNNPAKFLDGAFDLIEVRDASGQWVSVAKGGEVSVRGDRLIVARVTVTNLGEAAWLAARARGNAAVSKGDVCFVAEADDRLVTPMSASVPHGQSIRADNVELTSGNLNAPTTITLTLTAVDRTQFGERFRIVLLPVSPDAN